MTDDSNAELVRVFAFAARLAEARGVTVRPVLADLADWRMGESRYDLITKFYYYQPQLFERICPALRPGGRFMFQTFSQGQLAFPRDPRNPGHLAKPEEILPRIRSLRLRFYEDRILGPGGGASFGEEAVIRFIAEKAQGGAALTDFATGRIRTRRVRAKMVSAPI